MRNKNPQLYDYLLEKLQNYPHIPLPGINNPSRMDSFIQQIIASTRRVQYVTVMKEKVHTNLVADPSSSAFDPIKAAALHNQQGNIDEACWLVFLATNFGKNKNTKWNLVRDVYSGLTDGIRWNWEAVSQNVAEFRDWIEDNKIVIKSRGKVGNHRKYHKVDGLYDSGTGAAVASYVEWIGENRSHTQFISEKLAAVGNDPKQGFRILYNSMSAVKGFGRMGRFDYLTMLGKVGLTDIIPDSTYMQGATGPFSGARILFGLPNADYRTLDSHLSELEAYLGLDFGMQVVEDSICNWYKSQNVYVHFSG